MDTNTVCEQVSKTPMTKTEYFANHCSDKAKQKRKIINILSISSLAIQGILAILVIIALSGLSYAFREFNGASSAFGGLIVVVLLFTVLSFLFTLRGMEKYSTGRFIAATIFGFFSATLSAGMFFGELPVRQLIVFGTLAIYIVVTVLNCQNNKEYKNFLINNCAK